jgi:hypothetical protein
MSVHSEQIPFVVVQFPAFGDADFASRWLASAADADRILHRHRSADPDFTTAIKHLGLINLVEFSWAAMEFIYFWQDSWPAFSFNLFESEFFESFAYMAETGFFTRTGHHYHMSQPPALTSATIARALHRLEATADENGHLNPQWLLATMSEEDVRRWVSMIKHGEQARDTIPFKEIVH